MNRSEEELLLIEAYLQHRLDTYKTLQIEKRIKEDSKFAQKVKDYRNIMEGMASFDEEEFKSELEGWEDEDPYSKPKFTWWPMAAVIVALAVVVGYWLVPSGQTDTNDLFAAHFQPYDDIIHSRDIDDSAILNQAFSFYNKGQFDSAAQNFAYYLEVIPDRSIEFYRGVSLLAANAGTESLPIFERLSNDNGFLLQDPAQWYYGLNLLKEGESEQAEIVISKIAKHEGHDFQAQAQKILEMFSQS
ncbi:MAG: hypothetical protein OER04_11115 [Cyclobacteriaceae bacterium]|nr:hypothetical protein [Cyclobacteriaceae bacterium]